MDPPWPWSAPSVIAGLSRRRFGARRAVRLAAALRRACPGEGGLFHRHRDYCGHGLVFEGSRFLLCVVHDGVPEVGAPVASWADDPFVAFWRRQSDFTCSGATPEWGCLHTDDPFTLNNQRITRRAIDEFVRRHAP